jgi:hypothetical protein
MRISFTSCPRAAFASAVAVAVAVAACGSNASSTFADPGTAADAATADAGSFGFGDALPPNDGPASRACDTDEQCGQGGVCDLATHVCGCGGVAVASQLVAPNLLVVEDRSCSMTQAVGASTKWQIAVAALQKMTTDLAGKARFGLSLFPDKTGDACTQDAILVPVAPGSETAIQSLLGAALAKTDPLYPAGPCVTNIDTAMAQAAAEPALADKARASSVVLITDGGQAGCTAGGGDTGTIAAIEALAARGVGTFVVGFGASVKTSSLDAFAAAGGRVNPAGPHKYYDAQSTASLDAALAAIGKAATLSCDLALAAGPPNDDASLIYVYLDRSPPPLPRDTSHTNGWDYDPATKTVHLYGAACDKLKSGASVSESVVFGCPGAPPPPPK